MSGSRQRAKRIGWVVAASVVVSLAGALGCGGGGESSSVAPAGSSSTAPAPAAAPAQAGSFSSGGGGGGFGGGGGGFGGGGGSGGFVSGGGGGGGHALGSPARLGDVASQIARQEQLRRARIERAHRPPGPQRLTGVSDDAQRHADLITAVRGAVPHYDTDDDSCERAWQQHVAFERSYHATRSDGLMPSDAELAARHRSFITSCHSAPEEAQQCLDADYVASHREECAERAQTESDDVHSKMRRMRRLAPEPDEDE